MAKLDSYDTAGLTRYAISAGIIESSDQLTIVWSSSPVFRFQFGRHRKHFWRT